MAKEVKCYAAMAPKEELKPHCITRRAVTEHDVAIDIKWAGVCHSDIHQARDEWFPGTYPMVPGHEISGVVTAVGPAVTKFKVGDHVGVGCMVDSCRSCGACRAGEEQYCDTGAVFTYNGKHTYEHCAEKDTPTYGGYSQHVVVTENFVCRIPDNLDLAGAAPLLCAGITVWSPMQKYGIQAKHRIAVNGLGGLGHMAVKLGAAMGCHVTVLSRSAGKKQEALAMGAHDFVITSDAAAMKAVAGTLDFIVDSVSAQHDLDALLELLKYDGTLILVGLPGEPVAVNPSNLVMKRRRFAGSLIGGVRETQEMLDFCGRHNIVCEVEKIKASQINEAYERTIRSDVKFRFVIDTASL